MPYDDILQDGDQFMYTLRVPRDRVAVFIGEKGATKKQLEKQLNLKINIESKDGEVTISGADSLNIYIAKDIVKAIARGFNPEIATLLLNQDYVFELIDISDFAHSKDAIARMKGRVIGFEGKSWKTIEQLTECYLVVYGKTVAVIGEMTRTSVCKRAVEALLGGSQHAAVYKWLEKQRRSFPL